MAAIELILSHARRHCHRFPPSQLSLLLRSSSSPPFSYTRELGFRQSSTLSLKPSIFYRSNSNFLGLRRSFSSSSSTSSPSESQSDTGVDESATRQTQSASIKPVFYGVKPTDPPLAVEDTSQLFQKPVTEGEREDERSVSSQLGKDTEQASSGESRTWTREDFRYVKNVPSISPVSYPSRVAPLPEDRVASSTEEAPKEEVTKVEDGKENEQLEQERKRIQSDFRIRRVLGVEEEKVSFPTFIKLEKKKQRIVIDLQEAIKEVKASAKRNFVETVEAHVRLGVDPRRGDQMVRGATTLPHGTGKVTRVAVFAEGTAADEARAAGADIVGGDELIEEIRKGGGKLNFDKCIATPIFMPRLGKIARILGPRGLMPNPKLGSVTSNVAGAVQESKRGRIDFKIDKTAIVHVGLGKVDFPEEALRENVGAFVNALLLAKPVGLKKTSKYAGYVNSFTLCSTMGPGFPVSIQSLSMAADHYTKLQLK